MGAYRKDKTEKRDMKKVILTISVLSLLGIISCVYQPPTPPPVVIRRPADLAAESIFDSVYTDPTTGQSRPVIVGIVRNVGETTFPAGRTVVLIATTTVNGVPVTEHLASSDVPSLPPTATFQIIGNLSQSLNSTTQYTLSVSPGDDNAANDTFVMNPSSPPRY